MMGAYHKKRLMNGYDKKWLALLLALCMMLLSGCSSAVETEEVPQYGAEAGAQYQFQVEQVPEFSGQPYVVLNDNCPAFQDTDYVTEPFEFYSELDSLGRCGQAFANVCKELMPTEERGAIGQVKPTGWHTVKYDIIDDIYLYNRCHLIGFQLAGENANEKNLITGTRYMNVDGMLPFEDQVADYVKTNGNHVLYRVTPVFQGNNLVASGVRMEASSVEDKGAGLSFHVYVYNNQPGIGIDYATGDSWVADGANAGVSSGPNAGTSSGPNGASSDQSAGGSQETSTATYVLNTNTKKFHRQTCSSISRIKDANRKEFDGTKEQLQADGYSPCKNCNP